MASSVEFVEYVCGQAEGAGDVSYRKMFGEYGIYLDGKFIGVICDNQFFVKITKAGEEILPECPNRPMTGQNLIFSSKIRKIGTCFTVFFGLHLRNFRSPNQRKNNLQTAASNE